MASTIAQLRNLVCSKQAEIAALKEEHDALQVRRQRLRVVARCLQEITQHRAAAGARRADQEDSELQHVLDDSAALCSIANSGSDGSSQQQTGGSVAGGGSSDAGVNSLAASVATTTAAPLQAPSQEGQQALPSLDAIPHLAEGNCLLRLER